MGASIALCSLLGCAQTTIRAEEETARTNLPPPGIVLVYPFGVNLNEVVENQAIFQKVIDASQGTTQTERSEQIAHAVADRMADELVARITDMGLPAQRATRDIYIPPNALAITGHFIDVNEGNRLRRLVIGFGAGQSTVDTQVRVLERSTGVWHTVLEFTTHADSGAMPGAAVTMGAGAAAQGGATIGLAAANVAASGVKGYRSQVDRMAVRSADRAAQYLSEFFVREEWISPDKVQKPLLPGG
ncbi:MAG TPA: DUF4410 domain-containing protein [Candidatus Binatia bacterium]|nr:DUF4410 domain-containing protein [Candidatus Binatia bacterium]